MSERRVRAKFRVESVEISASGGRKIKMAAVTADGVPEHERFHRWTPSGTLEMWVDNPSAMDAFVQGKFMYLDFTTAEDPPTVGSGG
jgi:hypothetical protein